MNQTDQKTTEVSDDLRCPACHSQINRVSTAIGRPGFRKGVIVICVNCSTVLRVGDSALERLSRKDFELLPDNQKQAITLAAIEVMKVLDKAKAN